MKRDVQSRRRPSLRVHLLAAFALTMLLGLPATVSAQWTTADSNGNINSTNTGNVGIGATTTSPTYKLQVDPTGTNNEILWIGDGNNKGFRIKGNASYTDISSINRGLSAYNPMSFRALNVSQLYLDTTGNIGIGTTSPAAPLTVKTNTDSFGTGLGTQWNYSVGTQYNLKLNQEVSTGVVKWVFSQRNDNVDYNNVLALDRGNVGIGTTSLGYKHTGASVLTNTRLSVVGNLPDDALYLGNTNNRNPSIMFGSSNASNEQVRTGEITSQMTVTTDGSEQGTLGFWTNGGSGITQKMAILANGNVGIGTTSPTAKLHVNGNAQVTGNFDATGTISGGTIEAKYQDVAEWVPATHALPAGTVVTLNPAQSNQVTTSSTAYDTRVAGVISERPGLALGEAGKGKVLVATTGRVKVKVDATRSPIRIGDLLVTSDKEGVAMKSMPLDLGGTPIHRPGTLIGKALEPLEKGTGEILVLLSLQ
jgi:hypothetical protein